MPRESLFFVDVNYPVKHRKYSVKHTKYPVQHTKYPVKHLGFVDVNYPVNIQKSQPRFLVFQQNI